MRAAAVQFFATPFAIERNLRTAERLVREAAAQGAQLIVLPELFNTGYVYSRRLPSAAESDDGPTLRWLTRLSAELHTHIAGTLLMRDGERILNVFALVEPIGKIHRYCKQHPFLWERLFFDAGTKPLVAETDLGRIGLLVCWDIAFRSAWEAYRGKVDAVIIASAPPRFHRAVVNFPEARKVYVAELMPELVRDRDVLDNWYLADVGRGAAFVGASVIHSVMSGRFVTEIPFARMSFGLAAATRPRYWSWVGEAGKATLRATFYGCSAVFDAGGNALAGVTGEAGIAIADVGGAVSASLSLRGASPSVPRAPASRYFLDHVPRRLALVDFALRLFGKRAARIGVSPTSVVGNSTGLDGLA